MIDDGPLTFRELTNGAQIDRALDDAEWQSGALRLRDDGFGSTSTLTKEDSDWVLRSTGGSGRSPARLHEPTDSEGDR